MRHVQPAVPPGARPAGVSAQMAPHVLRHPGRLGPPRAAAALLGILRSVGLRVPPLLGDPCTVHGASRGVQWRHPRAPASRPVRQPRPDRQTTCRAHIQPFRVRRLFELHSRLDASGQPTMHTFLLLELYSRYYPVRRAPPLTSSPRRLLGPAVAGFTACLHLSTRALTLTHPASPHSLSRWDSTSRCPRARRTARRHCSAP